MGAAVWLATALHGLAADCIKTVRWNDDPPYSSLGKDGTVTGMSPDMVREALRRMACEPRFVEMPWARALLELQSGRLDILPGALRTEERERYAYFSRPTNRSPNVLFIGKAVAEKYRITRLADLIGTDFRLGAQIGVSYGPEYESLQSKPEFIARRVPVTQRRGAWKMIKLGRLDGMIADEVTGLIELQQLGLLNDIHKTDVIVSEDAAMFAFSKKALAPSFVDQFDQALEAMMADGSYRTIMERYLPCTVSARKLGCE
ncbi:transporter substrate-binding domain-containing protein [Chitinimonas naiadis]